MLSPGEWLNTGSFWDGFFNPTFWPSLVFRTFLSLMLTGVFALATAAFVSTEEHRAELVRHCAKWVVLPVIGMAASGLWYFAALPEFHHEIVSGHSPEMRPMLQWAMWTMPVILLVGLAAAIRNPLKLKRPLAVALLVLGMVQIGTFEWVREGGRRPWLVSQYLYSNGIYAEAVSAVNKKGALASAKWVEHKSVTEDNRVAAGRELFMMQCSSCHSIGGPMKDILPRTAKFTVFGMDSQLNGLGKLNRYMPPFVGTREERTALATYIVKGLHGKTEAAAGQQPEDLGAEPLPFDEENDEYILLAWNNLGMHCISDSDRYWTLLPPANDLQAQLILRGEVPEVITEGVTLSYAVEPGFENPAKHVEFWDFEDKLFGTELPENVGLSGNGMTGEMHLDEDRSTFEASLVPVVPYPDDGSFNPYPIFFVEARDSETGELLARTQMVAPTSTEMGCKNCHGGEWRVAGVAGFTGETSRDVLAVHDRINRTNLLKPAETGHPKLCQSCHADPVLGTKGKPGVLGFPAAIHGWHANYLTERGAESCTSCHPASGAGPTGCQRGVHAGVGLDCTSCHGTLEDHALSLLKKEHELGKPTAAPLMANLVPRQVKTVEEINGRTPWVQEPDCLTCHQDFEAPESRDVLAFNVWTEGADDLYRMRAGEAGIQCEACHGSTHAIYPARNIYGKDRDNLQPLQYQGNTLPIGSQENCRVCHTVEMEYEMHHANILREFRNVELLEK